MESKYTVMGREYNGWSPVLMNDGTGYTYINSEGKLMPYRFEYASEFMNGMATVQTKDGENGRNATYLTANGKLFDMRFDGVTPFYESYAKAYIDDEEYYVDKNGTCFQFKNTIFDKLKLATAEDKTGLFINNNRIGKVFTTNFNIIRKGREGMIPVEMKDGTGQTFMDRHFNIMKHRFLEVGDFYRGIAPAVTFNRNCVYVTKAGEVYPQEYFIDFMNDFHDNLDEQILNFKSADFKHYDDEENDNQEEL